MSATVLENLSPSGSTTEFSQSCAQMRPPFFVISPPPKPADFDWVRFNLTLISISDTKRQIWLTQGWTQSVPANVMVVRGRGPPSPETLPNSKLLTKARYELSSVRSSSTYPLSIQKSKV